MRRMRKRAKAWWPDWRTWPARLVCLPVVPMPLRLRVLGALGHEFAHRARIRPGTLVTGSRLSLGRGTFVNGGCLIDATAPVRVGDEVRIAHRVQILTADHELGPSRRRAGPETAQPVEIGDGAWVGAGAILLPGARIGAGCTVAAGAVVRGTLDPDGLYAGVPARRIRDLA